MSTTTQDAYWMKRLASGIYHPGAEYTTHLWLTDQQATDCFNAILHSTARNPEMFKRVTGFGQYGKAKFVIWLKPAFFFTPF